MKPEVGMRVHFWMDGKPFAATIAHVWNDTCVNLGVLDHNGNHFSRTSVVYGIAEGCWSWAQMV